VLFAGGGSGGHLFPGVALAEEFREIGWDAVFFSSSRKIESTIFNGCAFDVRRMKAPMLTKNPLKAPAFLWKLALALKEAGRAVDGLRPSAAVGLGGYASFSPVLAASRRGVRTFLLEQNAAPGKANRVLSRWADRVFTQWSESMKYFHRPDRVEVAGNPLRPSIRPIDRAEACARLGLDADAKTLLVMGGSQGAAAINRALAASENILKKYGSKLQILHLAGDKDNKELSNSYKRGGCKAVVMPFLMEMELAYGAADLVLARAGGTTIAELAALRKPAVMVPFPHAAEDHQRKNARAYAASGAAVVIEEAELTPRTIEKDVLGLLFNDTRLAEMRHAAGRAGKPGARSAIARSIAALAIENPTQSLINERSA